ncbi:Copper amine oxidase 1 [Fulvia fulva]|uniref:Amine oxidase n=1 Tax=Passalora fulva TaxID=5499 RepID=A0A9Q8UTI0_PASFU|nr:Copper amine oxidase 1 [Fulvia fulva]KAK4614080.1 Copper amine oxidase 1 [Fulvia fulva]UJO21820.1 Copper amine oxidase 1 [Fulvia fulva]WPV20770.1 Copper amine oxidase 1 [Fulvia fulva]WPV35401.1 Copper amine oxidase 1 [Fulvia fulva]
MAPHPLQQLSVQETKQAKAILISEHDKDEVLIIREIFLQEPAKAELQKFLALEHSNSLTQSSPRPSRQGLCQYDVVGSDKVPYFHEAVIDLNKKARVKHEVIGKDQHAPLKLAEFDHLVDAVQASKEIQDAIAEFDIPEGFEVLVEPWPYGGPDLDEQNDRYFQGLIFAVDKRNNNADSNFYAFPLPLIPVMNAQTKEIIRIDRLATGGKGDSMTGQTHAKGVLDHCRPAEYVPELLPDGVRKDLKALNVVQPDGPSFTVQDDSLIEWQKWRFRVTFNPREGAVIHDVWYDGRSMFYRLAVSEMTVPYADARAPFQRKQAFDFGDGGAGNCSNNLSLGCDCLGVIKYFDGVLISGDSEVKAAPNVICLHEQDNGIGWKHTNWRTGRAVVTRNRELVVQFIITLANYEYIFAYKFNQSGGIDIETRATGIVSCVNIDPGKQSDYGNVVSPGVLAQNHQHIFAVRIDPAIDGHANTVVQEESLPVPMNPDTNPRGNYYEVKRTPITKSSWADAEPKNNRVFKIINENKKNPISGKPVGFKLVPPPTQLLLASPDSVQAQRATFATHHLWVTKYKDDELYAAGRYTLQSRKELGGVADAVARNENVENEDVVVWSVFGLTHNPRVEDWPVMPVEMHQINLRPADFFEANPSIDVPSGRNAESKLVVGNGGTDAQQQNGNGCYNGANGHAQEEVNGVTNIVR